MQLFAPLIATGKSSPQDVADYKQAYREYYTANGPGARLAKTLGDISPSEWAPAIANMGKAIAQWHKDINTPRPEDAMDSKTSSALTAMGVIAPQGVMSAAKSIPRIARGAFAGVKDMAWLGLSLGSGAFEQAADAIGNLSNNPKDIDAAAEMAVMRLKQHADQATDTANPYTEPADKAEFEGGRLLGNLMIPVPGAKSASAAIRSTSDALGSMATKATGGLMKMTPGALKTAGTIGAVGATVANPGLALKGAATAIGSSILGDSGGLMSAPYKILQSGNAVKNGVFKAIDATGDAVMATPKGQSMIAQIADTAPQIMDQAKQAKIASSLEVARLKGLVKDAVRYSEPTGKLKAALASAQAIDKSTEIYQNLMERGTDVAQWMKANGAAAIPSKMADAVTGAAMGAVAGQTIGQMNAQPGQSTNPQAAAGAATGTLLAMLGGSAYAAQSGNAPKSGQYPPRLMPPAGEASSLRQAANEMAVHPAVGKNPRLLLPPGEPIDVETFSKTLNDAAVAQIDAARAAGGKETFDLKTEKALGSGKYDFPKPSDQDLRALAAKSQEINAPDSGMKSSVFDRISYDPQKQIGLLRFGEGKAGSGGVRSYAVVGITPEKWDAFAKGLKPELGLSDDPSEYSMGKYFNQFIKKYENTVRVYDDLWGQQKKPPGTTILNPESAPTAIKDFLNKTKH